MRRLTPLALVLAACASLLSYDGVDRHVRGVGLLMRWTHAPGSEALRRYGEHPVTSAPLTLQLGDRTIDAIEYRPTDIATPPPIVLIHGAHYRGMRESRLKDFATALASAGLLVVTPQLDELTQHNVAKSTITTIEHIARGVARRTRYEAASVVGISFSGSLALLAAAQQSSSAPIGAVTAIGAYGSLQRLGLWYAGDDAVDPDGNALNLRPHPYGARVLFQAHADTVFGRHAERVRRILHAYLRDDIKRARTLALDLPDPPRSDVLALVSEDDHPLADKLRALLHEHRQELAAVSPTGQLSRLNVPTLLAHGTSDPIIPSTETAWLARDVPAHALRQSLITSAIRHAELQEDPSLAELWALVQFASALLEVTELQQRAPRPL